MQEHLLQYLWQYRLYASDKKLMTTDGQEMIVINPGQWNRNTGPDFLEAQILIQQTRWVGHVELHLRSSDWLKHKHQDDENYTRLILHVVYEHDSEIRTSDGSSFPTLELKPYLNLQHIQRYQQLQNQSQWIPCESYLARIPSIFIEKQKERMLAERLERRNIDILNCLHEHQGDWKEVFYIELATAFGLHINRESFRNLARRTPLKLLSKYKNSLFRLEALLFGQAGFLYDYFEDEYPLLLQQEYEFHRIKHQLEPMTKNQWKFLRLRPANFPSIRIAQFAQLIHRSSHLLQEVLDCEDIKKLSTLFMTEVSGYWWTHYHFAEASKEREKRTGPSFIQLLLINVVIPFVYVYGKAHAKDFLCERALLWLSALPHEDNQIISQWKMRKIPVEHAADSQALLQLKTMYCDHKRCLECGLGYQVLRM